MTVRWVLMLVMATVLAPAPAAAEFYRYRDQNGTVRFTDNLTEVPPEQRANLKAYRETVSPAFGRTGAEADASVQVPEPETTDAEVDEDRKAVEETAARLRQRQEALIREYEALQKDRAALARRDGQRVNNAQQARYAEAVEALNAKIRDYQQRREAYERDVQAHNARMARQAAPETAPATEP